MIKSGVVWYKYGKLAQALTHTWSTLVAEQVHLDLRGVPEAMALDPSRARAIERANEPATPIEVRNAKNELVMTLGRRTSVYRAPYVKARERIVGHATPVHDAAAAAQVRRDSAACCDSSGAAAPVTSLLGTLRAAELHTHARRHILVLWTILSCNTREIRSDRAKCRC